MSVFSIWSCNDQKLLIHKTIFLNEGCNDQKLYLHRTIFLNEGWEEVSVSLFLHILYLFRQMFNLFKVPWNSELLCGIFSFKAIELHAYSVLFKLPMVNI